MKKAGLTRWISTRVNPRTCLIRFTGGVGGGEGSGEGVSVGGGPCGGDGGDMDMARVVRVCGAAGGAVHGLCFEGTDGRRAGSFLENSQAPRAASFVGTRQPLLHTVAASTDNGRKPVLYTI